MPASQTISDEISAPVSQQQLRWTCRYARRFAYLLRFAESPFGRDHTQAAAVVRETRPFSVPAIRAPRYLTVLLGTSKKICRQFRTSTDGVAILRSARNY